MYKSGDLNTGCVQYSNVKSVSYHQMFPFFEWHLITRHQVWYSENYNNKQNYSEFKYKCIKLTLKCLVLRWFRILSVRYSDPHCACYQMSVKQNFIALTFLVLMFSYEAPVEQQSFIFCTTLMEKILKFFGPSLD